MAWHRASGRSIADWVARELQEPVINRSVTGARIINILPISGAMGMRISSQLRPRKNERFDWVIVTGGGNDLWLACGCHNCDHRMNRMISDDGRRGDVVSLVRSIRKTGAKVVYLGYLRSPGRNSPIESCKDEGDIFEARLEKLAALDPGVHFFPVKGLVKHGDRSFHGVDMIHPSKKASAIIGKHVAQIIRQADATR